MAVDLANAFASAGHEVSVLAGYPVAPALLAERLEPSIELRFVATADAGRYRRYVGAISWMHRNGRWFDDFDIVHAHMTYGAFLAGLVRFRRQRMGRARPAVVETAHSVGMPMPRRNRSAYACLASYRDALAVMAEDPFWEGFRARRPRLHSELILNGVSSPRQVSREEAGEYRGAIGIPEDATAVVGTIGVMRPERKAPLYADIFAEIGDTLGPESHFILGGTGPEMPRVRETVAAEGMADRIHLPGLIHEPALPLALMDLYLALNVGAVTGVAAIEAALAGVPVLGLQVLPDYRPTGEEWIWSTADPDALATRAVELLRDRPALAALAEKQQAYAKARHGVERMAKAYESLYEAAIRAAAGTARTL